MRAVYIGDRHVKDYNGIADYIGNGFYRFRSPAGDDILAHQLDLSL